MKKQVKIHLALFSLCLLLTSSSAAGAVLQRERASFNTGWRFHKIETAERAADLAPADPAFDDSQWRTLDLPHDWAIEGPFMTDVPNCDRHAPVGWCRLVSQAL